MRCRHGSVHSTVGSRSPSGRGCLRGCSAPRRRGQRQGGRPSAEPTPAAGGRNCGLSWLIPQSTEHFLPWLGVSYDTSAPVADQHTGYSTFEAFVPIVQGDNALLFFNGKSFVDNDDRWGSNLGLGGRWYNANTNRILGGNVYWDNLDTGTHSFNQIGVGFESLGRYLDFRVNGYMPMGRTEPVNAITYTDPSFYNHFILLNQNIFFDAAMSGFDSELGGGVPYLGSYGLRAYGGVYGYQASSVPSTIGGHFRLEERVTDNLDLNLIVNSDRVFKTTVTFAVGFRFGGGFLTRREGATIRQRSRPPGGSRPAQRQHRGGGSGDHHAGVRHPAGNQLADLRRSHRQAMPRRGGNGTFEHPFNTLQNPTRPVATRRHPVRLGRQRLQGARTLHSSTTSVFWEKA